MNPLASTLLHSDDHRVAPGLYAWDAERLPWRETPRGTAREKAVRRDDASGQFLGMLHFDALSRSGLHQHLGTAISYFLHGSLTDYQGTTGEGAVGINLAGATHDAVSYTGATLVSRLEGPVAIPRDSLAIHPHADLTEVRNARPGQPPDITVSLANAVPVATRFGGITRRPLFDYAGTGDDRRMCSLTLWPRTPAHRIRHAALTEYFVLAGDLRLDGRAVAGPAFVIMEPGVEVSLSSEYGCCLLAWADGPGLEATQGESELYGFR